jgi:hypothetical protein
MGTGKRTGLPVEDILDDLPHCLDSAEDLSAVKMHVLCRCHLYTFCM